MPDSVAAYDISQPLQPLLMGEWSFSGARGAVPWQGGVLAFGDEGFAMVDESGMRRTNAGQCSAPPILSAATAGKRLYALTDDGVAIYDARLCKLRTVELGYENSMPQSIVAAGSVMAMGSSEGIIDPWNRSSHYAPAPAGRASPVRSAAIHSDDAPDGCQCAGRTRGRIGVLLDVGNEHVEEVAWFAEPPWFSRTARIGNLLAHRATDANRLEFYRLGPSVLL